MDCICLSVDKPKTTCHAQPIRQREIFNFYIPTEDELKTYCQNAEKFPTCPRLIAFQKIGNC